MIDIIKVKATNTEGRVALWDRDATHPTGEVFVSGDGSVVEVANTAAVRAAIKAGALVEVQPEVAKAPAKQEVKTTTTSGNVGISELTASSHVTLDDAANATSTDKHSLEYKVDTKLDAPTISAAIRQEGSKTTKR